MGENLPEATWTCRGSCGRAEWKLVIAGEKGEVTVAADGEAGEWVVRTDRVTIPELTGVASFDVGEAMLASLVGGESPTPPRRGGPI